MSVGFIKQFDAGQFKLRRLLQMFWPTPLLSPKRSYSSNLSATELPTDALPHERRDLRLASNSQVVDLVSSGVTVEAAMVALNVPEYLWRYYDISGRFDYRRDEFIQLSSENGRYPLSTIRLNFEVRCHRNAFLSYLANCLVHHGDISKRLLAEIHTILSNIPTLHLQIVTRPTDVRHLEKALDTCPVSMRDRITIVIKYIVMPETGFLMSNFSNIVWARDGSKPLYSKSGNLKTLMQHDGNNVHKPEYRQIITALAKESSTEVVASPFRFEGGNIIAGDRHVFVGPVIVESLIEDARISEEEALAALESEFGKQIIVVGWRDAMGRIRQIIYHIDLCMAIAVDRRTGEERVFVESPMGFLTDFLGLDRSICMDCKIFNTQIETFIAQYRQKTRRLSKIEREFLLNLSELEFIKVQEKERQLTAVEKRISKLGYKVERLPGMTDIKPFMMTYNCTNLIFSNGFVLGPKFDIEILDSALAHFFSQRDYELIPMTAYQLSIRRGGGISCLCECYRATEMSVEVDAVAA